MERSEAGKKGYEKTGHILRQQQAEKSLTKRQHYEADPKVCPTCEEVIPYEKRRNKFCSQSCSATYNNQGVTRHAKHPEHCAHCGAVKETRRNKYCDTCIADGVYNPPLPLDQIRSEAGIRRHLMRTRKHKCEVCGLSKWLEQPIVLQVHHIDGNPDHNVEENLQLLCPNCHALTDNYSGSAAAKASRGRYSRRRKVRRRRYKEGKSW